MAALKQRWPWRHWVELLRLGALSVAVPFLLYAWAALRLPAGYSALLNSTVVVFGTLAAAWMKEDTLTARKLAGCVVGFAGVGLIVRLGPVAPTPEVLLATLACIAAYHHAPGLCHERAVVAHIAPDDDIDALHRDPTAGGRIALHHEQAAVRGRTGRLRGVALHDHGAAHHVLGDTGAGVTVDEHGGLLVHSGRVVTDVPVDRDDQRRVHPRGDTVRACRIGDQHLAGDRSVQGGVHLT